MYLPFDPSVLSVHRERRPVAGSRQQSPKAMRMHLALVALGDLRLAGVSLWDD
jgi:hypothetical protein